MRFTARKEMRSYMHCFRVGVVLLSLAPPTLSFSHGASHASCRDMIPGHIRAQPQDPQHNHVALHTSTSSYLPGHLVTVTVRSSRDFMGFLLQARSVEGAGIRTKSGVGDGVRPTRVGPMLVGGSWTLAPPGTHTLRCLSEGDTITHSDKQLKRNLSFVWRAPDVPMGDVRFYITVVQSYFVYWAGIESAVLQDGSRGPWKRSNTTLLNGGSPFFALKEDVPAMPDFKDHQPLSTQTADKTASPATTLGPTTATSRGTQSYKSLGILREDTHTGLLMNSPTTSTAIPFDHQTKHAVTKKSFVSLQNVTKGSLSLKTGTFSNSESHSVVSEEVGTDTGNTRSYTNDSTSSRFLSTHLPVSAITTSAEAKDMKATSTLVPDVIVQNLTSPPSLLQSLVLLKDGKMERKKTKFQDTKLLTNPDTRDTTLSLTTTTTTTSIPFVNHSLHTTNPSRPTTLNQTGPIQDQTISVKFETPRNSSQPWMTRLFRNQLSLIKSEMGNPSVSQAQNPHLKLLLQYKTSSPLKLLHHSQSGTTGQTFTSSYESSPKPTSQSQMSLLNTTVQSKSPTLQSFLQSHTTPTLVLPQSLSFQTLPNNHNHYPLFSKPDLINSLPGYKTGHGRITPSYRQIQTTAFQTLNHFPQTISTLTRVQATSPEAPHQALGKSTQTWPQTGAPWVHTFGLKQLQPIVTSQTFKPVALTSKLDQTLPPDKDFRVLPLLAQNPPFAPVSSSTDVPSFSESIHLSSSSSTHSLSTSTLVDHSFTISPESAPIVSTSPLLISSSSFSASTSLSRRNKPMTTPTFPSLSSPSPISIPPHTSPVQSSFTSTLPLSFTTSTIPSSYSSTISSTLILPSSTTRSPTLSTFSSRVSETITPASSPLLPSFSSSSTSIPTSASSSSVTTSSSSPSTTTYPRPSAAPRRSFYNPKTSSKPSLRLTVGQRLLIQNHIESTNPEPNLNPSIPKTVVHPNPDPHPNLNPNFKLNNGNNLKPNLPKTDNNPKGPPMTPDKEGKYPDIIPRHSAWELGMLLGCSAGLGMVLVVGVRYVYRQACGKRTEVTLNDREREYGRGERGLIHVQECGDLVRVRRLRDNSFVLLAEYDILASPGD